MIAKKPQRAIFTVCSSLDITAAEVLFSSLKIHHPEASLWVCLADKPESEVDWDFEGIAMILAEDLAIANFADFAFRYESIEFKAAVKPFAIAWLLEYQNFAEVIYLDPNIELFAPLNSVITAFATGANFVLTPNLIEPYDCNSREPRKFFPDLDPMKIGIFNLAFIGIKNNHKSLSFVHWWSRRCRYQCLSQPEQGIFLDQKFVDFLPAFVEHVAILRDRSLNLTYLNLNRTNLTYQQAPNTWYIDDAPLKFFQFSGLTSNQSQHFSTHPISFDENLSSGLQALEEHYSSQLARFADLRRYPPIYSYRRFTNNVVIAQIIRQCYRDLCNQEHPKLEQNNPFDTFCEYLNQPSPKTDSHSPWLITRLMQYIWSQRPDLKSRFNLKKPDDCLSYCRYFAQDLASEYELEDYFLFPIIAKLTQYYLSQITSQLQDLKVGVIGYLRAETGVGNAARMLVQSLRKAEVQTQGYNVTFNIKARQTQTGIDDLLSSTIDAPIQILNINADQLSLVRRRLRRKTKSAQYLINMPFWELSKFPQQWLKNYQEIDEVWAASRFIQTTLQTVLPLPVLWMPIPVTLTSFQPRDRSYFRLPRHTFLFHYNFDFSSFASRKNPTAAIKAYRLAFQNCPTTFNTALVIKTRGYDPQGENLAKLQSQTAKDSNILILNQEMSYADTFALMNCCDCYVSLHRSEGFGFTPAEAMLLNKPVIATDYSGTRDFVNQDTGFPVNYQLIPVQPGEYPCWENQVWAEPDLNHAAWLMRKIVEDETKTKAIAKNGQAKILRDYSPGAISQKYIQRLVQLIK